jgi:hypothetical protein
MAYGAESPSSASGKAKAVELSNTHDRSELADAHQKRAGMHMMTTGSALLTQGEKRYKN